MNRRVRVRIGSILGLAWCWTAAIGNEREARAQVNPAAPAPAYPPALVAAQQAGTAPVTPVHDFVAKSLAMLSNPNPAVINVGRKQLIDGCPQTATASFHTVYATELATQGSALLVAATPQLVRLNIGIVARDVAIHANTAALVPLASKLLADPNPAVALWGAKVAKPLVVTMIMQPTGPGKTPLFGDLVGSVKSHNDASDVAGYLAADVYSALVVDVNGVPNMQASQVIPKLGPLYDPLLDLIETRTKQYDAGLVPIPNADARGPGMLSRDRLQLSPAQTKRSVQALTNLLLAVCQRAPLATNPKLLAAVKEAVLNTAQALNVFAGGYPLGTLGKTQPGATGQQIQTEGAAAFGALQNSFAYLQQPAPLPPKEPPAPPAAPAPAATPTP